MAYSKTWDTDAAPEYGFFGERSMEKVEDNAALMLNGHEDNPVSSPGVSLATYTNNTGYTLLVSVGVTVTGSTGLGAQNAQATFEFRDDPADPWIVAMIVSANGTLLSAQTRTHPATFIVPPGGQYRVRDTGAGGTVNGTHNINYELSAAYTAQSWPHGTCEAVGKFNAYAAGVGGILDPDGVPTTVAGGLTQGTWYNVGAETAIVIVNDPDVLMEGRDNGGSGVNLARITPIARSCVLLVNADGDYRTSPSTGGAATTVWVQRLPIRAVPVFVNGETGVATGQKFRDLDQIASEGSLIGEAWTRTGKQGGLLLTDGSGNGHTLTAVGTPHTTRGPIDKWRYGPTIVNGGSQALHTAASASLVQTGDMALLVVIDMDSTGLSQTIARNTSGFGDGFWRLLISSSERVQYLSENQVVVQGSSTLATGRHVVEMRRSGTNLRVWIDGTLEIDATVTLPTSGTTGQIILGSNTTAGAQELDGPIYHAATWIGANTPSESELHDLADESNPALTDGSEEAVWTFAPIVDAFRFVAARVSLEPGVVAGNATATLNVNGVARAGPITEAGGLGANQQTEAMLFAVVGPGEDWTVSTTNATVTTQWEWTIPV